MYNTRVSRKLFNECFKTNKVKALAFAISVKRRTSTIVGVNCAALYNALGEIAGCSQHTARRMMEDLCSMGLATIEKKNGKRYATFGKLREQKYRNKKGVIISPVNSDIILNDDNCDFSDYKTILVSLRSQVIVETQSHINFFTQLSNLAKRPGKFVKLSKIKSAKKALCYYGVEEFDDKGVSNKCLMRKMKCGSTSLANVITFGESIGLFERIPAETQAIRVEEGCGALYAKYTDVPVLYSTYSHIVLLIKATSYRLLCRGEEDMAKLYRH